MTLYVLKEIEAWAVKSLRASGYDVTTVDRVYIPKDEGDGDCEVIYRDGGGAARTAYLQPDGLVLATRSGW